METKKILKKNIGRAAALLCTVLLVFTLAGCASEAEPLKATEQFYVKDFADVLSPEDEQLILSKGVGLAEQTKAQVVAVTVETTNGQAISDFALELGRSWGVGDGEENNKSDRSHVVL